MAETIDNKMTKLAECVVEISNRYATTASDKERRRNNVETVIRYEIIELLRMIDNIKHTSLPGELKDRVKELSVQYMIDYRGISALV